MSRILACVDGSSYGDSVCLYASWIAMRIKSGVDVLHVLRRNSEYAAESDLSGSIGLGARSHLLEELTKVDEERGKLDQKKGKLIIEHAAQLIKDQGISDVKILHKRGSLIETITELEPTSDVIIIGKRGEHADPESDFLGSNLEKVARAVHKPLFVSTLDYQETKAFLISYDGSAEAKKAVSFASESPLLKGLDCHLLAVTQQDATIDLSAPIQSLELAGFTVHKKIESTAGSPQELVAQYVLDNAIDLVLIGAYSHSKMRRLLLGSTTAALVKTCKVPLMLFR